MPHLWEPWKRRGRRARDAEPVAPPHDEVDLLRASMHTLTGVGAQSPGHHARLRALRRLREPPPPRPERGPHRTWPYVALALAGFAVVLAAAIAWHTAGADRGEILYLNPEPLPGQSGRIARYSVAHLDDPAALRQRVDERTGAIIIPADRLDDLNGAWLAEQYAQGIVIIAVGRITAPSLAQAIGVPSVGGSGVTDPAYAHVYRACDGSSVGGGTFGGPFRLPSLPQQRAPPARAGPPLLDRFA